MRKKKGSFWKLVFLLLLGLVLVTPIVGYLLIKSYIHSGEFSSIVKYQLSKEVGGRVEVANSEWDGWTLQNEKISVLAGEKIQDVELNRVSVELDPKGFFDKVWRVSNVHVRDVSLHLGEQNISKQDPEKVKNKDIGEFPVNFSFSDAWKTLLPREVELDSILIENSNGSFNSSFSDGVWHDMSLHLERSGEDYAVEIPGGNIELSVLKHLPWKVARISGRVKPESYFINEAELIGGTGVLKVAGEGDYDGKATLQGELKDFLLSDILKEDWKQRVNGEVNGDFVAFIDDENSTVKGHGWIDRGTLTALPILDQVASKTGIYKFRQVTFDTCEFDYFINEDFVKISNLQIESRDFVKITGRITKKGDVISGVFQLGFTDEILEKMPKGSQQVFTEFKDGYYWTAVQAAQENGEWEEDLTSRMVSAVASAYIAEAPKKASKILGEVKEFLEDEDSTEKIDDVIEKGSGIIDTGVKSLFDLLGK